MYKAYERRLLRKNLTHSQIRNKAGIFVGVLGVIFNLFLSIGKFILGILSLSITIIADAINSLTDSISSILVILGFKISNKPADESHPYGYARFEYVTGLIIAVIILLLGIYMIISSILKIITPSDLNVSWIIVGFLAFALIVKIFLFATYSSFAKHIDSPSLVVASKDARNDCLSATAVLVFAILNSFFGNSIAFLDGVFGTIVSLVIIITGFSMILSNASSLIGKGGTDIEIEKIKESILEKSFVLDVHSVQFHKYGKGSTYVNAHIGLDGNLPLIECNNLVNQLESELEKKFNIDLTLRVDAIDRNNKANLLFRNKINNILDEIDEGLEIDYISVIEKNNFIEIQCEIIFPLDFDVDLVTLENIILSKLQNYKKDIVLIVSKS